MMKFSWGTNSANEIGNAIFKICLYDVPTCNACAIKAASYFVFLFSKPRTLQKNRTLKTLFDIRSEKEPGAEHSLLLEIGKDYCTYAVWHKPSQSIDQLQFISFQETEGEEQLSNILSAIKVSEFTTVYVCSAMPQSILVPNKFFNSNYEALDTIYNQPAQEYFNDRIAEWQMVNIYSVPQAIHRQLQQRFPAAQYIHAYTPAIKVYNGYVADNQLSVHFTPQYVRVLLKKDTSIHLAQTYYYASPLDVVYYLLKICYEFELDQSSVFIILSGLVEKESNLYTELEQYFTNIHFAHPPEFTLPENNLPHYFFTSLYNLATCVS
ncbi:MAG: DUF3822 family protein [Chitinophagaceae bacterium]|nr:MAG: DUF3822 family protein [Chitinophagaceae bacterium]